jgi:hypothetical protein
MKEKGINIFALLAIFCLFLLTRNLLILKFVQPVGYVVNIYSMFPFTFYLSFILCYLIATVLVLNRNKKLGYFILCLNHLEILLIPYMLGYYSMGRADDMSYIGEYLQIATSGHFAAWDIYPASHTIGAFMSILSAMKVYYISFIIPIIFSFIFIIGIYLFSRELISQPIVCSLVIVSSFILYMGAYNFLNVPHALFFALLPLYLCYFYKYTKNNKNMSLSIVFVLMTLLIPLTHPFIVFFVFSFFLLHMIPKALFGSRIRSLNIHKVNISSFLILVIAFMSWFIYNSIFTVYFKRSYLAFINKITEPVFFGTVDKLAKINLNFFDYLQLASFFYGRYIIPTLFISISLIFIYHNREILKSSQIKEYPYIFILYFTFLILQIMLLFNPLIVHQSDRITNLNFIAYAQIPLFSIALYVIFLQKKISFNRILQVSVILAFIWSLCFFGCFDSPNIYKTNAALTYNEVYGMDWFYRLKGDSIINAPLTQLNRFHDLFGNPEKKDKLNYLPDHFGYVNESDLFVDSNLGKGVMPYTVVLTIDELLYQEVKGYTHVGRYKDSDFVRFRRDISVNKIYDSTNIEIFKSRIIDRPQSIL